MQYDRGRSRPTEQSSLHIEIRGLTKRYGPLVALDAVDLSIDKGELFSLVGSSGCGKTTLLRSIAGFVRPDAGQILIDNREMTALEPYERPVNMMFQSYALFPHMSVADNIAFGLRRERLTSGEIRKRVNEALDLIQMSNFARRRPHQLSGGQRQRVALARAVVKRPQVLLLDEPLSALDKKLRESTQFELMNIQEQLGITFILVTHDQEEAMTMSTRIGVMSEGRIIQIGTPSEIYEHPCSRFVADFIGSVNLFDCVLLADSEGLATLRCDSLSTLLLAPSIGAPIGAELSVAIRPERLTLSPTSATQTLQNSLEGRLASIAFMGDRRIYQVAVQARDGHNRLIKISEPNAAGGALSLTKGEKVHIGWNAAASLLLRP